MFALSWSVSSDLRLRGHLPNALLLGAEVLCICRLAILQLRCESQTEMVRRHPVRPLTPE